MSESSGGLVGLERSAFCAAVSTASGCACGGGAGVCGPAPPPKLAQPTEKGPPQAAAEARRAVAGEEEELAASAGARRGLGRSVSGRVGKKARRREEEDGWVGSVRWASGPRLAGPLEAAWVARLHG